jgi:nucleotide-binding universal stress UspA family protein
VADTKQRIVVGVDGSAGGRLALVWAFAEAARRDADLEVVTAFPVDFYWNDPYLRDDGRIDDIRADTEERARAMLDEVRHAPDLAVPGSADVGASVVVCAGAPAAHLVDRSAGAVLLVVGSRGRGAARSAVAGSVALHCAAHARCPVAVVHARSADPAARRPRVVVGLDDSDHARAALAAAVAEAGLLGARVDAVLAHEAPNYWSDLYAVLAPPAGETHEHALEHGEAIVREALGPEPVPRDTVRVVAAEGHPGQVLVREAAGAELLVVGSRSRNQLEGLVLGSVALHCVLHAPCPVLVVHPPRGGGRASAAAGAAEAPAVG